MIWDETVGLKTRATTPGTIELVIISDRDRIFLYGTKEDFNNIIGTWYLANQMVTGNIDNRVLTVIRESGEQFITLWTNVKSMRYLVNDR